MIPEFENLDDREVEIMFKAPILVSLLIAGADGNIDRKEIREAITIAAKQARSRMLISGYLRLAAEDFEDKMMILQQSYPSQGNERQARIIAELGELNTILPKLNKSFAVEFYNVLRELASKVATSSGGWLGLNAVGSEEAQHLELSMINNPA
jgi:hypothetical protein